FCVVILIRMDSFVINKDRIEISSKDIEVSKFRLKSLRDYCDAADVYHYVIDLNENKIIFASENLQFLFGLETGGIENMGYEFYTKYIPEEDLRKIEELRRETQKIMSTSLYSENDRYSMTFNFRLRIGEKVKIFQHRSQTFMRTENGVFWMVLCSIHPTYRKETGEAILRIKGEKVYYQYDFSSHKWMEKTIVELTEREKAIVALSAQGYTEEEIAAKLFKSHNSIKTSKRILFRKLGVTSIAEALMYSLNNHLL
ncbi:MAG: helix-turn-helix transcriptional regulator, partial [Bacteroidaceae bacterium]|nr:helix-turn-helix transcriptional regulator [Bacteroidaceae bacterium]